MRNDDPMYLRHLESALEAAELEIKGLEGELREQDKVIRQLHDQLSPTHMGEPLITRPKVGAHDTATLRQQIRSEQIAAGEDAVTANLRSMGLLPANAKVTGSPALSASPRGLPGYAPPLPRVGCPASNAIDGKHERDAYGTCGLCGHGKGYPK